VWAHPRFAGFPQLPLAIVVGVALQPLMFVDDQFDQVPITATATI
jgi:hypothetical protein